MNRTTIALLIKLAITFVAAWLAFGFIDENSMSYIILVTITGTILNYLAGDLFILPNFGNIVASIGDGVMGAIIAYIISLMVPEFIVNSTSLIVFAGLVAITEYFFHVYLLKDKKVAP